MSRPRLALLAALLCALPGRLRAGDPSAAAASVDGFSAATPPAAPLRLVFTYPCSFAYSDGKPYATRVLDWECDYVHASIKGGADYFNKSLPNLVAQEAFLGDVIPKADKAHNDYLTKVAALIAKTDPSKLPATLTPAELVAKTAALNIELSTGVFAAAQPFLWPAREEESYVSKTAGEWPRSWDPYLQPIYERAGQLAGMTQQSQMKMIDDATAALDSKLRTAELKRVSESMKAPDSGASLDKLFDGLAAGGAGALPAGAKAGKKATYSEANVANAVPLVSDLKSLPPPIPADQPERVQRNYFARGVPAAEQRLQEDATVGLWHAFGLTTTVGEPNTKAPLAFHQEGPSCDISVQAEALQVRGKKIPVAQLAQEGLDKGYYVDYETSGGSRDGGPSNWAAIDLLLRDHGVSFRYVENATPQQLDQAFRDSPHHDAIVYIKPKAFWNDPSVPDSATHAIYLTGEEVDKSGKVRGYYFNDTGTGEAARFVTADEFYKVWLNRMTVFPKPAAPAAPAAAPGKDQ